MQVLEMSNSELSTWRRCRRRWFIAYFLQKGRSNDGEAGVRQLGSRIHTALEGYYGYGVDPVATIRDIYLEDVATAQDEERMALADALRKESELAVRMVEGYVEWVTETGADEGLEVVHTEQKLVVPFGTHNGYDVRLKGRLDLRVRREHDGASLYIDHKTVGGFETDPDILHLDGQFRFYNMLEHLHASREGTERPFIAGGIRNMIRRVKRTATAKPPFYKREVIQHNDEDLRSTWRQTLTTVTEITAARQFFSAVDISDDEHHQLAAQPNFMPSLCRWDCDFKSVCGMMDDGSDWLRMLEQEFVDADPYAHYSPSTRWENLKMKKGGSQ